jgi:hypothetical protein
MVATDRVCMAEGEAPGGFSRRGSRRSRILPNLTTSEDSLSAACSASGGSFSSGASSGGKPLLEGGLTFSRRPACQEAVDADVLVQQVPMNAASPSDQTPAFSFGLCGMHETWKPVERYSEASPVAEFDGERVIRDGNRFYCGNGRFNRQSIHAKPLVVPLHDAERDAESDSIQFEKILRFLAA